MQVLKEDKESQSTNSEKYGYTDQEGEKQLNKLKKWYQQTCEWNKEERKKSKMK
jgi:hypothetical protein